MASSKRIHRSSLLSSFLLTSRLSPSSFSLKLQSLRRKIRSISKNLLGIDSALGAKQNRSYKWRFAFRSLSAFSYDSKTRFSFHTSKKGSSSFNSRFHRMQSPFIASNNSPFDLLKASPKHPTEAYTNSEILVGSSNPK